MLLYLAIAILAVIAGLLVYRYDLYDKEPWWMLLLAAGAGVAMMWGNGHFQVWLLSVFEISWDSHAPRALLAGVCEEGERILVVVLIAILTPRWFNDPIDGLIYGSIVGLGMAVEESWFFLGFIGDEAQTIVPPAAELVRLAGHMIMGGISCFALGMARMKMRRWPMVLVLCAGASILLHALWDWLSFSERGSEAMPLWKTLCAMGLMAAGMFLYGMLVVIGSDWSRRVFAPHSPRQLWGWPLSLLRRTTRAQLNYDAPPSRSTCPRTAGSSVGAASAGFDDVGDSNSGTS